MVSCTCRRLQIASAACLLAYLLGEHAPSLHPLLSLPPPPPPLQLACGDGLSLLHRAVQSGSADMLRAVLGWGEDAGSPWRCDLAGEVGKSVVR